MGPGAGMDLALLYSWTSLSALTITVLLVVAATVYLVLSYLGGGKKEKGLQKQVRKVIPGTPYLFSS